MLLMIKQIIEENLKEILSKKFVKVQLPQALIFDPPKEINADYYTNAAFVLAKAVGKSPTETAEKIITEVNNNKAIREIAAEISEQKGFINFKLKDGFVAQKLVEVAKNGFDRSGLIKRNKERKIIVEYSSPNIAKKMHAGHLRSTIIGDAIKNIFLWLGYRVISWNHTGDWGTQFGKLLYMYKKMHGAKKTKISIEELEKLYIKFNKEVKRDPSLQDKAKKETKKLQDGDKVNLNLWRYFTEVSLNEFNKFYKLLDIKFDYIAGESFYQNFLTDIVKNALDKKIAVKSQGAVIILLEKFNLPPFLIQKSDGAFMYGTTDLASLKYRIDKFNPEKIIYVVANEQTLHFEQLFAAAKLLGLLNDRNSRCAHVKFGLLLNETGKKFSTRGGVVVHLENLINEIVSSAHDLVSKKNHGLTEKEKKEIAEVIGIGAIKYNDLSRDRQGDIVFDKKKMLSLEGNSAPYLQYTFVRINSVLKKAGRFNLDKIVFSEVIERDLAAAVLKFPETVLEAAQSLKPNIVADYLYNLASRFHYFYEVAPILSSPEEIKNSRLILIKSIARTIKEGLGILGIKTPEKM